MSAVIRFLIVAIVGFAAVWYGIPALSGQKAGSAPEAGAATRSAPDPVTAVALENTPSRAPVMPEPVQAVEAPASAPAPVSVPASAPAPEPQVVYVPADQPAVQMPGVAPSDYDWGVLYRETTAFGSDGKSRGKLPAGTVIEIMQERESKQGLMFQCRVLDSSRRWDDGYIFPDRDVVRFLGCFAEAEKEPSDKVIRYFTLKGRVDAQKAVLHDRWLRTNPHFESYSAVAKEMLAFQEKGKALTAERDAATGARRQQISAELNHMKTKETDLTKRFKAVEAPYKQWKEQHASEEAALTDSNIDRWMTELRQLHADVAEMVEGLEPL